MLCFLILDFVQMSWPCLGKGTSPFASAMNLSDDDCLDKIYRQRFGIPTIFPHRDKRSTITDRRRKCRQRFVPLRSQLIIHDFSLLRISLNAILLALCNIVAATQSISKKIRMFHKQRILEFIRYVGFELNRKLSSLAFLKSSGYFAFLATCLKPFFSHLVVRMSY